MLLEPLATENIIVGVKWNSCFGWYVTKKNLWFMDFNKMDEAYAKKFEEYGLPFSNLAFGDPDPERQDIPILDENTIVMFSPRIKKYSVTVDDLREHLRLCVEIESPTQVFYDLLPSLYLDFDNCCLYSMHTEPASFEDYVPQNWTGEYADFLHLLEQEKKFWQDNEITIFDFSKGDQANG